MKKIGKVGKAMRKRVYVLGMLAAIVVMGIAGCSASRGENEEIGMDEIFDIVEEVEEGHFYSVQACGLNDAILEVTSANDSGENELEETGSIGWSAMEGTTIAQIMEEWNVISIEAKCDGYEFLGWQVYENTYEIDEDGFEVYGEQLLYDGKVFTTDEMMNMELPDADIYFASVWDLTCDRCQAQKVCSVYYIDDDCYFICDECYDAFAHEVGLE